MNTFHPARLVLCVMLGISLSSSSPLERLKRSLDDEGEGNCPPGVWTCLTSQSDARMLNEPQKRVSEPAKLAAALCPPGVWTCLELADNTDITAVKATSVGDASPQFQADSACPPGVWTCRSLTTEDNVSNDNYDYGKFEDLTECPPGIWVCRKKRMLKRMLRQARRVQRSAKKCPPGIWVC